MGKESEIQHFGFSAEQVSIERIYLIKKILNSVFDCVLKKIECSRETSQLFAKQKDDVVQAVMNSIGDHIKTCESLDKKYFSVPDHVLLPPYFDHAKSYTNSDEKQIDEEIQIHRSTFLEVCVYLNLKLNQCG